MLSGITHTLTRKQKNMIELEVELDSPTFGQFIERAIKRLGDTVTVPGFRKGKVPGNILREKIGLKTILADAADGALKKTFPDIVKEENLITVGPPKVDILMLAEGNPFRYRATSALLPKVTLGDLKKLTAKRNPVSVTDEDTTKAIDDLRNMRRKEILSLEAAKQGDKVEVDLDIFRDGVPLDGGTSKSHPIVLGEGAFIPGFEEQLVGLKPGEDKEFRLPFPGNYHQKHLAGKDAQFRVKVVNVYRLERPEANDEFARGSGEFASLAELKKKISENLRTERTDREEQRLEAELLDQLISSSTFEEIPDLLIDEETERMLDELDHDITQRGMKFDDYLSSIKKTRDALKQEFNQPALRRIKSALLLRELAKQHNISVSREEVERERARLKEQYAEDPSARGRLDDEDVTRYLATTLTNRAVLAKVKELALQSS